MAYPKERQHLDYLAYVEQYSNGEGEYADQPKMSKAEWLKRTQKNQENASSPSRTRSSSILGSDSVSDE